MNIRIDTAPKRSEHQQTYRYIFPVLSLWADGYRYKQIGFAVSWWKWTAHFFFNTAKDKGGE